MTKPNDKIHLITDDLLQYRLVMLTYATEAHSNKCRADKDKKFFQSKGKNYLTTVTN